MPEQKIIFSNIKPYKYRDVRFNDTMDVSVIYLKLNNDIVPKENIPYKVFQNFFIKDYYIEDEREYISDLKNTDTDIYSLKTNLMEAFFHHSHYNKYINPGIYESYLVKRNHMNSKDQTWVIFLISPRNSRQKVIKTDINIQELKDYLVSTFVVILVVLFFMFNSSVLIHV